MYKASNGRNSQTDDAIIPNITVPKSLVAHLPYLASNDFVLCLSFLSSMLLVLGFVVVMCQRMCQSDSLELHKRWANGAQTLFDRFSFMLARRWCCACGSWKNRLNVVAIARTYIDEKGRKERCRHHQARGRERVRSSTQQTLFIK